MFHKLGELLKGGHDMAQVKAQLSVFFEEPFWIGIYERLDENKFEVCKITFGSEPKDYEVYSFLDENWKNLKFSPPVPGTSLEERRINPKRLQRKIARQVRNPGIGTKAQQALKALREESKAERKMKSKREKETEMDRKYQIRQQKRKEKHKGR